MTGHAPPNNVTQLAGLIERETRAQNQIGAEHDGDMSLLCGLVAHHSARYTLAHGLTVFSTPNNQKLARAKQYVYLRVRHDTSGLTISPEIRSSLIRWAIGRFIQWLFDAPENRSALAVIATPLPMWGNDDDAIVARSAEPLGA